MPDLNRIIRATAPPTIANLAVGFDLLGLAVQGQGDVVTARFETSDIGDSGSNGKPSLRIESITGDGGKLSKDIHINTISAGVIVMLEDLKEGAPGFSQSIVLSLDKRMPLGSGMGSSASSAAAAVMAVNELLGRPFDKEGLVKYALIGESVASGAIHGDNVVPSLLGGLILMRENEPADIIKLPFFEDLFILLVHPHVEVMTAASRGRLAEKISLAKHIRQNADIAAFIHAVHEGDKGLLARCLNDHIIGPQRKKDIPSFEEARELVMEGGGLNYDISGSGPSAFAFFESADRAMEAGEKLTDLLSEKGIGSDIHVTRIDQNGARIVEEEV